MKMPPDDGLDYINLAPPEPGQMVLVAPGIHWIRMPLPLELDHINLWFLEDREPVTGEPTWTIVDTGMATGLTKDLWRQLLDGPAADRRFTRLIVTHYHPDHFGLAGWLREEFGVVVLMTELEWTTGNLLARVSGEEFAKSQDRFFARHGVSQDVRDFHMGNGNPYTKGLSKPPDRFQQLEDGEVLEIGGEEWRILTATGHAPELACLYNPAKSVLISADQILPQITPIVSVWWYKAGMQPLQDFLDSLRKVRTIPDDVIVLPSHRQPFKGLHKRIAQLGDHHEDRLDDLRHALSGGNPSSVAALVPAMFRRDLNPMNMLFAVGEALAHIEHLIELGEVVEDQGPDGTSLYRAVAPLPTSPNQTTRLVDPEGLHE